MKLVELQNLLSEHESMEFPEFPEDAAFADWVDEFFEIDDYYFGVIHSMIDDENLEPLDKAPFETLKAQLPAFADTDPVIYQHCQDYMDSLETLIDAVD